MSIHLESIRQSDIEEFRKVVEAYWEEVMPHSDVLQSVPKRDAYFQSRFLPSGGARQPCWAMADEQRVGFVAYSLNGSSLSVSIDDFYILPKFRRRGYGTATVQALYQRFDQHGVERIQLDVRRDTPLALAFWESQGFRIALYHMRQYRDPASGESFIGGLSSDFV